MSPERSTMTRTSCACLQMARESCAAPASGHDPCISALTLPEKKLNVSKQSNATVCANKPNSDHKPQE